MNIAKKSRISILLLLLAGLGLTLPTLLCAEEDPIYVEADQMSSTDQNNTILFKGNVDAKKGDLRIRSDEMTVQYQEPKEGEQQSSDTTQQVEKLICIGNVEITREDWLGTSQKMVYLAEQRQVVLTGDAKAWQGQNMVSGEKIIYYMDDGRSEVVGAAVKVGQEEQQQENKSRVRMTIRQQ